MAEKLIAENRRARFDYELLDRYEAGVVLTGTSRVFDLVRETELVGTAERPLVIPPNAVVVPGTRPLPGEWPRSLGLAIATALIVKDRDPGTDARVAIEAALR